MMWTTTKRILNAGLLNFWRNGFVSIASVLVMVITLTTVAFIIFIGSMLSAALIEIREKVDVNVYFYPSAPESSITELRDSLVSFPEVAAVDYISREQALTNFVERHEDDELTLQALEELGDNPLGAVLNIKAQETSQYAQIAEYLEAQKKSGVLIDRINYFDNKVAIERLTKIIESADQLGLVAAIILILVSVLISFNTIRLVIFTSREEITVMRLVGASPAYVRGPYVVSGIFYGLLAALLTLAILYPITLWLGPTTERFFGSINLFDYFLQHFSEIFLILITAGVVLGGVSSWLAVRRYLKI